LPPCAIVFSAASAPPDRRLFVIAGTQVVCAERLEVLALGARIRDLDGLPLAAVLDVIRKGLRG